MISFRYACTSRILPSITYSIILSILIEKRAAFWSHASTSSENGAGSSKNKRQSCLIYNS